jgi:hypothetical protein
VAATSPTTHAGLSGLELAAAGVTWGHIDDQAQTIAGAKTFTSHPLSTDTDVPTGNELIPVAKLGPVIAAAANKSAIVDADKFAVADSANSDALVDHTFANLKAALKTYFDTLYAVSSTYTPTLSNDANIDASTAYQCVYNRTGNVVTVSGEFAVDPTSSSAATSFRMTLPISSNLTTTGDCSGVAVCQTASGVPWNVQPSTATDQALFSCSAPGITGNAGFSFIYQYIVR